MSQYDDLTGRALQDMGIDPAKIAAWEQTPEGKAALERFRDMCDRGEIIHRSPLDPPPPPIRIEDIAP